MMQQLYCVITYYDCVFCSGRGNGSLDNEYICIVLCMVCDTPSPPNPELLFVFLIVKELVIFGLDDHVTREVYSHTRSNSCSTQLSGIFYFLFCFVAIKDYDSSCTIFLCNISDIHFTHTIISGPLWPC